MWPQRVYPATPSLPFVLSPAYRGSMRVSVMWVTVADRWEPTKPGAHGTRMARRQMT
jgi:hypothetical protein